MPSYDAFAPFYDALMGGRDDVVKIIHERINRHHPEAKTILELGCGTGEILAGLGGVFELHGIDLSLEMLKIAQQKLPYATLTKGDIASYRLAQQFDVIFCVFDTINHLTTFEKWRKFFALAKKHLRANGLFIFDMDTIARLRLLAASHGYSQEIAGATADLHIASSGPTSVQWHIIIQETGKDGAIQVYEDRVKEVSFPLDQVEVALREHFEIIETFDSESNPPSERSSRIYYVCRPAPNTN